MSAFEPEIVVAILKKTAAAAEIKNFEQKWAASVEKHWKGWRTSRDTQSHAIAQLEWASHVVEYVNFLWDATKSDGRSKVDKPALAKDIPILGPRFVPPSYIHVAKRNVTPNIVPETAYLKPLNIVHPFYFPELRRCPQCGASDGQVKWAGWNGTGHREVHGIRREETALGFQLRCDACEKDVRAGKTRKAKEKTGKDVYLKTRYCFALTSDEFWERRHHWEIPLGVPYFFSRCAVTRELFDMIVELRLTGTAGGLSEHIKQLHLLEYHQQRLHYIRCYERRQLQSSFQDPPRLQEFSKPFTKKSDAGNGYDNTSITDDLISDVYDAFSTRTRREEAEAYMRTLIAICISLDNTFRLSAKATVIDDKKARMKIMRGGILSTINEFNEILSWRFCQSQAHDEIREQLTGLKKRFEALGVADPEIAVVDNCCHVRQAIEDIFPDISVVLDVWHFMMRYMIKMVDGAKNPLRASVARDITDAILKTRADKQNHAEYWPQHEQEHRLQEAYGKWKSVGGVWMASADETHVNQLAHVRKGCLARPRQDIATDGSRIESTHKGWNSLQRSHLSGLETLLELCTDYVHRRNIRIGSAHELPRPFLMSTFGSHHTGLVDGIAKLWNRVLGRVTTKKRNHNLLPLPEICVVDSGESFGLVKSQHAGAFYSLEDDDGEDDDEEAYNSYSQRFDDNNGHTSNSEAKPDVELVDLSMQSEAERNSILRELNANLARRQNTSAASAGREVGTSSLPPSCIQPSFATAKEAASLNHNDNVLDAAATSTSSSVIMSRAVIDASTITEPREDEDTPVQQLSLMTIQQGLRHIEATRASAAARPSDASEFAFVPAAVATTALAPGHVASPGAMSTTTSTSSVSVPLEMPWHAATRTASSSILSASAAVRDVVALKRKATDESHGRGDSEFSAGRVEGAAVKRRRGDGVNVKPQPLQAVEGRSSSGLLAFFPLQHASLATRFEQQQNATAAVARFLPAPSDTPGLTRSGRLFAVSTGIDPRSLSIGSGDEWFIFMDLRIANKWISYEMKPRHWVAATSEFNRVLKQKNEKATKKVPRALMEKLSKVEADILRRIATADYKAKGSGNQEFWKKQCESIQLLHNGKEKEKRKKNICNRCHTIMWPYPVGSNSNHERAYCADGVAQKGKEGDELPAYPQPAGVFSNGNSLRGVAFLNMVREVYQKCVVENNKHVGDHLMEYTAFIDMVCARSHLQPNGTLLFKLFPTMPLADASSVSNLIVKMDGAQYLRIESLGEPQSESVAVRE